MVIFWFPNAFSESYLGNKNIFSLLLSNLIISTAPKILQMSLTKEFLIYMFIVVGEVGLFSVFYIVIHTMNGPAVSIQVIEF